MGRHQLAVRASRPVGPEQQQRVVERSGPLGLALVDADRAVHAVRAAGLGERVDERPGHVDRVRPQPLPQLVEAAERPAAPRPRRWTGTAARTSRAGPRARRPASAASPSRRDGLVDATPRRRGSTGVAWTAATRTVRSSVTPREPTPVARVRADRCAYPLGGAAAGRAASRPSSTRSTTSSRASPRSDWVPLLLGLAALRRLPDAALARLLQHPARRLSRRARSSSGASGAPTSPPTASTTSCRRAAATSIRLFLTQDLGARTRATRRSPRPSSWRSIFDAVMAVPILTFAFTPGRVPEAAGLLEAAARSTSPSSPRTRASRCSCSPCSADRRAGRLRAALGARAARSGRACARA